MYTHSHPSSAFKYWFPIYQRVSYNLWKYKCRWVSTQLSSLKQSTVLSVLVLLQQTNNMQFKVISALAFATLAAAGAFPRADPTIAPPVPGTPTINASKCNAGQLQCCRFHFPKVVIVLWWKRTTIIGKSADEPNAPAVAPHLPSGIPASSISGLVGLTCSALPAGAQPNAWSVSTRFMNDSKINLFFFFTSPDVPLCCTDNSHGKQSVIRWYFFCCPLIFFFGNVKAMPFPSVATGLTLARKCWIFIERGGVLSPIVSTNLLETFNLNRKIDFLIKALFFFCVKFFFYALPIRFFIP